MARNRIVINLDQPGGPQSNYHGTRAAGGRRFWPKVLALLLVAATVVIAIVAGAAFLWWRNYQRTPAYSLALMIDAAQRDDLTAFREVFDDEQVSKHLVASVSKKAGDRYGIALTDSLQRRIDDLVPTLLPQIKDKLHSEVAKEIKTLTAGANSKPFILVALTISSFVTISTEGDNAMARPTTPGSSVELAMRRDGDRWKIIEIKNDVLVQRIVDGVMKDLPAIGALDLKIPLIKSAKPRRRRR